MYNCQKFFCVIPLLIPYQQLDIDKEVNKDTGFSRLLSQTSLELLSNLDIRLKETFLLHSTHPDNNGAKEKGQSRTGFS